MEVSRRVDTDAINLFLQQLRTFQVPVLKHDVCLLSSRSSSEPTEKEERGTG